MPSRQPVRRAWHARLVPLARLPLASGAAVALATTLSACGQESPTTASATCAPTARYPNAVGCAYLYGRITDTKGVALDSIEGSVRMGDVCNCSSPRIDGDDNGFYSVTVHRLAGSGQFVDTASATVVALASAPKYPRHVTGAAYFDTARVVLHFVPLGAVSPVNQADLRIPLPGR